jgi:hypothetical protein
MVCIVNVILVIMLFQLHDETTNGKHQFRQNLLDIGFKAESCRNNTNFFINFKGITESLVELKIILQKFYRNDAKRMEEDLKLKPGTIKNLLADLETRQAENFEYVQLLTNEKDYTFPDYMRQLLGMDVSEIE